MTDITLEQWRAFLPDEREAFARYLVGQLPSGFTYHSLTTHGLGNDPYQTARFEFEKASFVLVPGGPARLGYDANRPWQPTLEEYESWRETAEEYEIDHSIQEEILLSTLRPRDVLVPPLLVEAKAVEIGWEPFDANDTLVKEAVEQNLQNSSQRQIEIFKGGVHLRIRHEAEGIITAERAGAQTHQELTAVLAKAGFRLPTFNEWEYICGGGSETLFRWGDHVPCDRYPTDINLEEARWRREWVLSAGKLEYPKEGFTSDWDFHTRPNNFGVYIASNPYNYELVAEPEFTRGGDGGGTICGGAGFFAAWLTLATAYFQDHACKRDPQSPILAGYTVGRRVLPLE